MTLDDVDPEAKERVARAESSAWDVSGAVAAEPGDIPIIDMASWIATGDADKLARIAEQVDAACQTAGFFQLTGHTVPVDLIAEMFEMNRRFHSLPLDIKQQVRMDRPDWPVSGVGYLPMYSRKLPSRDKANLNEAFLVKGNRDLSLSDSQWITDEHLPGFRSTVERHADAVNELARRMLTIYSHQPSCWIQAPIVPDAFVVNGGELLKQGCR